jgi:hypothetical protein
MFKSGKQNGNDVINNSKTQIVFVISRERWKIFLQPCREAESTGYLVGMIGNSVGLKRLKSLLFYFPPQKLHVSISGLMFIETGTL